MVFSLIFFLSLVPVVLYLVTMLVWAVCVFLFKKKRECREKKYRQMI